MTLLVTAPPINALHWEARLTLGSSPYTGKLAFPTASVVAEKREEEANRSLAAAASFVNQFTVHQLS